MESIKIILRCKRHNPKSKELSYIAWSDWANKKNQSGEKQIQCTICKRWYFEEEF